MSGLVWDKYVKMKHQYSESMIRYNFDGESV